MMSNKLQINDDAVRKLAEILNETNLTEIEYDTEAGRIRVARSLNHISTVTTPQFTQTPVEKEQPIYNEKLDIKQHTGAIKSPMVGTAYLAPEPGAEPFVKKGDQVQTGQTLLIIEAMKVMNPIKATKSGKVIDILVSDASPVEFNEPLIIIE